jgi:hypothetical protein
MLSTVVVRVADVQTSDGSLLYLTCCFLVLPSLLCGGVSERSERSDRSGSESEVSERSERSERGDRSGSESEVSVCREEGSDV